MTMPTRREALCDAAIRVIARDGLRGLTHRAVDRAAGVPVGSTSYYFRTRLALLTAVTDRLLAVDLAEATAAAPTAVDVDAMAHFATQVAIHWTGPGRDRMLARYEVSLESVRHPSLRARFLDAGTALRTRAVAFFARSGARDPQRAGRDFVALLDGLIYDQLVGAGGPRSPADLHATIRQILSGLLSGGQAGAGLREAPAR